MAEANPAENLVGETTCSICLTYYIDPVTTPCGHSFCHPCLQGWWDGADAPYSCPQCRKKCPRHTFTPNRQLANIVAIAKELAQQGEQAWRQGECGKHGERRKLFCRKEHKAICVVCRESREHRAHEVLPLEEAAQEYKEKLKNWLHPLKQEKEEIQEHQSDVEKQAIALKNQVATKKQKTLAEFDQLYKILRNEEQSILSRLEEMDMKIMAAREANLTKLSEEISRLGKLIDEMEEKMTWPAEEFLEDVKNDLKRCQNVKFRKPEEKRKNYKVFTTLDPKTANPLLSLSADGRSMRLGGVKDPSLPRGLQQSISRQLSSPLCVLGCERFTSGRRYWEVEVSGGTGWSVGGNWRVGAAKQFTWTKDFAGTPCPATGIWAVERRRQTGDYQALTSPVTPLPLRGTPRKIGIYLDYEEGRLSFYDASNNVHIYSFKDGFRHPLVPYFGVGSETELRLV